MPSRAKRVVAPEGGEPDVRSIRLEDVLHALSDPVRLEIVRLAARERDLPCNAFFDRIPKSTLSHHWKVLTEAGLIHQQRSGTQKLNSLRKSDLDARFPGLIDAVLGSAAAPAPGSPPAARASKTDKRATPRQG